jgi:regulation of enolase protein 1 (concanavalin A-like superfamily)
VTYGLTGAYELGLVTSNTLVTAHSLTLEGLSPATVYHYQVSSTDASGNTAVTQDATFSTSESDTSGITSDDFTSSELNTQLWTFVNPQGDGSVTLNGTQALLSVPDGVSHDVWSGGNFAPRLMQAANNTNFEVEVKFDSPVTMQYQMQGILVEQDSQNFLRFDFYSDGGGVYLFAAHFTNGSPVVISNATIPGASAPMYMRVRRQGNEWTQFYSLDGQTWATAASFSHTLEVTQIGIFVGNTGGSPPAHTAIVDYFFNTASPIIPED